MTEKAEKVAEIVEAIEVDIALGRLMPRERLVEKELAERFEANRNIVRQAIADLEIKQLVSRPKNKGAAVKDIAPEEVEQIYAVREILERAATLLIPLPLPPEVMAQLRECEQVHSKAIASHDLQSVYGNNIRFHKLFFSLCGNSHLVDCIDQFASKAHPIRSYSIRDSTTLNKASSEHREMLQALEQEDRPRLLALVKDHIQPAKKAYLESYRRTFGAGR